MLLPCFLLPHHLPETALPRAPVPRTNRQILPVAKQRWLRNLVVCWILPSGQCVLFYRRPFLYALPFVQVVFPTDPSAFRTGVELGRIAVASSVLPLLVIRSRRNADHVFFSFPAGGSAVKLLHTIDWFVG